jgi:hypothetical protein
VKTNMQTLESDLRDENRKFAVQAAIGAVILAGVGFAFGNYVGRHRPPTQPQVIVIQFLAQPTAHP